MGSVPAAPDWRLTRRPPPALSERPGVSYALLTPGVERLLVHFTSQARTIEQREKAFVPAFLHSRGNLCAHGGVAIGSGHGNLLGVGVEKRGVQMNAGHRADRASVVERCNPHIVSLRESGYPFDFRQTVQSQVRPCVIARAAGQQGLER